MSIFWIKGVRPEQNIPFTVPVAAVDKEDATRIFNEYRDGGAIRFEALDHGELPVCKACDHLTLCREKGWNEPVISGDKSFGFKDTNQRDFTDVHRCPGCQDIVLSRWMRSDKKRIVSIECPRYSEAGGCAIHCAGCRSDWEAFEQLRPSQQAYHQAVRGNISKMFGGDVEDTRAAIKRMIEVSIPQIDTDQMEYGLALYMAFVVDITSDDKLKKVWDSIDPMQRLRIGMEFVERAHYADLVYRFTPNRVEQLTQLLALSFTNWPGGTREWCQLSIEEQQERVVRWRRLVEDSAKAERPEA